MPFLFENVWGILAGIVILSITMLIVNIFRGLSAEELIIYFVGFVVWYLLIVLLNFLFPQLKIIRENKLITAILSIIFLKITTTIVLEKFISK